MRKLCACVDGGSIVNYDNRMVNVFERWICAERGTGCAESFEFLFEGCVVL